MDRPLTRRKDYDRYAGHVARIELKEPLHVGGADRRRFQGHLLGLDGDAVRIAIDGLGANGVWVPFQRFFAEGLPMFNDCWLDFMDFFSEGFMMPLGAMIMALMVGWELKPALTHIRSLIYCTDVIAQRNTSTDQALGVVPHDGLTPPEPGSQHDLNEVG